MAIAPAITFVLFSVAQGSVDRASRVFSALLLIQLCCEPVSRSFQAIPKVVNAVSCLQRIQLYLTAKERSDRNSSDRTSEIPSLTSCGYQLDDVGSRLVTRCSPSLNRRQEVIAQNLVLRWTQSGPPVLCSVDISIAWPGLTLIVGPPGCGKSTLLKAMIGEVPYMEGFVLDLSGNASYCNQAPWLPSATIRQNIIAFTPFDSIRYNRIIEACALTSDFQSIPNGDRSSLGGNGDGLSGGQRQRIVGHSGTRA